MRAVSKSIKKNPPGSSPRLVKTLTSQLLAIGLGTMVFFTVVYTGISIMVERKSMERAILESSDRARLRILGNMPVLVWNYDLMAMQANLLAEIQAPDLWAIAVLDENDRTMVWVRRTNSGEILQGQGAPPEALALEGSPYVSRVPLALNGRELGHAMVVVSPRFRQDEYAGRLLAMVLPQLGSALVTIGGLLIAVQLLLVRRIRRMAGVLTTFAPGGYSVRMEPGRPDELGQLSEQFNVMAQTIGEHASGLEQLVQDRTDQLIESEKLAALGRVVAGFAHEVNTPLGTAVTVASYGASIHDTLSRQFLAGNLTKGEMEKYLSSITNIFKALNTNLERSARLMQRLKQLGHDQTAGERNTVSPKDLFSGLGALYATRLATQRVRLDWTCDPAIMFSFPGDSLSQILRNLIDNCLDHGFSKGKTGLIRLVAELRGDILVIEVIDNGHGVGAQFHKQVFTPFFTTVRNRGHVGLGLFTVYMTVLRLDGSLQWLSNGDGGLTMTILLPAASCNAAQSNHHELSSLRGSTES